MSDRPSEKEMELAKAAAAKFKKTPSKRGGRSKWRVVDVQYGDPEFAEKLAYGEFYDLEIMQDLWELFYGSEARNCDDIEGEKKAVGKHIDNVMKWFLSKLPTRDFASLRRFAGAIEMLTDSSCLVGFPDIRKVIIVSTFNYFKKEKKITPTASQIITNVRAQDISDKVFSNVKDEEVHRLIRGMKLPVKRKKVAIKK